MVTTETHTQINTISSKCLYILNIENSNWRGMFWTCSGLLHVSHACSGFSGFFCSSPMLLYSHQCKMIPFHLPCNRKSCCTVFPLAKLLSVIKWQSEWFGHHQVLSQTTNPEQLSTTACNDGPCWQPVSFVWHVLFLNFYPFSFPL